MHIANGSFIMVVDGRKRLLFRNEGDGFSPDLRLIDEDEQINPANRDQRSGAPGRTFSSVGAGRSAYEETDFHQLEEDRFASETARKLKERALNGDFDSLLVVAPPATLGELRKHYHVEVVRRLTAEIPKDLTGHPVGEIEKILVRA